MRLGPSVGLRTGCVHPVSRLGICTIELSIQDLTLKQHWTANVSAMHMYRLISALMHKYEWWNWMLNWTVTNEIYFQFQLNSQVSFKNQISIRYDAMKSTFPTPKRSCVKNSGEAFICMSDGIWTHCYIYSSALECAQVATCLFSIGQSLISVRVS